VQFRSVEDFRVVSPLIMQMQRKCSHWCKPSGQRKGTSWKM